MLLLTNIRIFHFSDCPPGKSHFSFSITFTTFLLHVWRISHLLLPTLIKISSVTTCRNPRKKNFISPSGKKKYTYSHVNMNPNMKFAPSSVSFVRAQCLQSKLNDLCLELTSIAFCVDCAILIQSRQRTWLARDWLCDCIIIIGCGFYLLILWILVIDINIYNGEFIIIIIVNILFKYGIAWWNNLSIAIIIANHWLLICMGSHTQLPMILRLPRQTDVNPRKSLHGEAAW